MGFFDWQEWFGDHIYRAILVTATLEGMGLPIPCELLFFPGVHLARTGAVSLWAMVLLASLGNLIGGLTGFFVAWWGGNSLFFTVSRWLGIKSESMRRVESFFARYGQAAIFFSRFVGVVRTATIYAAGAARMSPLRFGAYLLAASLIWNSAWVFGVARFEHVSIRLLQGRGPGGFVVWLLAIASLLVLLRFTLVWWRRRRPTAS